MIILAADKLYLIVSIVSSIVSDTQFRDLGQISQTVLRSGENGLVLLEDKRHSSVGRRTSSRPYPPRMAQVNWSCRPLPTSLRFHPVGIDSANRSRGASPCLFG